MKPFFCKTIILISKTIIHQEFQSSPIMQWINEWLNLKFSYINKDKQIKKMKFSGVFLRGCQWVFKV